MRRACGVFRTFPNLRCVLIAFNKPYGVPSVYLTVAQPDAGGVRFPKNVYPIGRLDADSEDCCSLSDEPKLNQRLLHPPCSIASTVKRENPHSELSEKWKRAWCSKPENFAVHLPNLNPA
jgi:hypothetical protein